MVKTISAMNVRQRLGQVMNEVQLRNDHYIVERAGKPIVAIVPVEEFQAWMRRREKLFQEIDEVRARNRDADPTQVEADIEEAVAAVRAARKK